MESHLKIIAIIPARMASTRFPGKPLVDILGLSMIEHVRRRVALSPVINETYVATCDKEIMEEVTRHGGKSILTSPTHERCTDRIAEAALTLDADIVINVQGDEPMVRPEMFEPLINPLIKERELLCTNLMVELTDDRDFVNTNVVKTVCDLNNDAVYFSREPIPSYSKAGNVNFKKFKQLGIIAFRSDFLNHFIKLPQTPLEKVESVDMLRIIEHGFKIKMVESPYQVLGVDTPEDLDKVLKIIKKDNLLSSYI